MPPSFNCVYVLVHCKQGMFGFILQFSSRMESAKDSDGGCQGERQVIYVSFLGFMLERFAEKQQFGNAKVRNRILRVVEGGVVEMDGRTIK